MPGNDPFHSHIPEIFIEWINSILHTVIRCSLLHSCYYLFFNWGKALPNLKNDMVLSWVTFLKDVCIECKKVLITVYNSSTFIIINYHNILIIVLVSQINFTVSFSF